MKNSNCDVSIEHVEEWSVAYLEGLLSPEEKSKFEKHLEQCPECAKQIDDMSHWVALLKSNKDALCPEEWELFDYVREGADVTGAVASHASHCPSCRKSLEDFRKLAPTEGVPDSLWDRMTRFDEPPAPPPARAHDTWLHKLWKKLADALSPPLALAGAVAAAILVVVLLYPFTSSRPLLELSTVTWAPDRAPLRLMGKPEAAPAKTIKEKAAIVVYLRDFKDKPAGERIDSFYRLLEPGKEVRFHYEFVSPSQVKEAAEGSGMKDAGKDEILRVLREKLSVSRALIVELSQKEDRYGIHASLTDTATGAVVREIKIADVREANLSEEIEAASDSVLKSPK